MSRSSLRERTMILISTQTAITLISCVLAMLHHPDVLHQAQNQLDEVIGRERIPTFEDKDNLPYVQAIVRETLRWRPAVPTGLPHLATKVSPKSTAPSVKHANIRFHPGQLV